MWLSHCYAAQEAVKAYVFISCKFHRPALPGAIACDSVPRATIVGRSSEQHARDRDHPRYNRAATRADPQLDAEHGHVRFLADHLDAATAGAQPPADWSDRALINVFHCAGKLWRKAMLT